MSVVTQLATRRRVLRGILGGAAISVGLPFLDCFLNNAGTALAATGAPLPVRFGNWFWGCGLIPGRWEPASTGAGYKMSPDLAALARYTKHVNVYSGFKVSLDGNVLIPHNSGYRGVLTGTALKKVEPSVDSLIADVIGAGTRFRSVEVAATGNPSHSVSRRSATVSNPAEVSPGGLYARIFGPEFRDPNAASFTPDPRIMAHKSVLSAVKEPREALLRNLGAADRARMDEYFTSLRQLEQQIDLQLQKPAPLAACTVPPREEKADVGTDIEIVKANHRLMTGLLASALACDQTRVINIAFSDGPSSLRRAGDATTHHILTHEEAIDEKLGYQPQVKWFGDQIMESFAVLLDALNGIREGDGTLFDRTLVLASSECGFAKSHTLDNIPMITAGGAAGRVKTGLHVAAKGESVTRLGLTLQQAFGVPVSAWGTGSMATARPIAEILA